MRHPPCCMYSYIQSNPVKILAVVEKRKKLHTVKSSKNIDSDSERRKSTLSVKNPLSFEIWIFCNGQTDRDVERRVFTAMTYNLI
jgi:hypothetical protein